MKRIVVWTGDSEDGERLSSIMKNKYYKNGIEVLYHLPKINKDGWINVNDDIGSDYGYV